MKKLVQERFKGYEKFAEDSLRGTKFSQNKIRGMKFFTKKIRGRKKMGSREKMLQAGTPPLNKCPALYHILNKCLKIERSYTINNIYKITESETLELLSRVGKFQNELKKKDSLV